MVKAAAAWWAPSPPRAQATPASAEGHSRAGHPAASQLVWPSVARTPPGWSETQLPTGTLVPGTGVPMAAGRGSASPQPGPARLAHGWSRLPAPGRASSGAACPVAQSREPLGGQPDPLGPTAATQPWAAPQAGGISSLTQGPCLQSTSGTEHCQVAQDRPQRRSIPAPGRCWSHWGHLARTVPAHGPPSTPPEIAWLPPPRQLPAASSPLPTADPRGGKGGGRRL